MRVAASCGSKTPPPPPASPSQAPPPAIDEALGCCLLALRPGAAVVSSMAFDALWSSLDLIQCITLRDRPERRAVCMCRRHRRRCLLFRPDRNILSSSALFSACFARAYDDARRQKPNLCASG